MTERGRNHLLSVRLRDAAPFGGKRAVNWFLRSFRPLTYDVHGDDFNQATRSFVLTNSPFHTFPTNWITWNTSNYDQRKITVRPFIRPDYTRPNDQSASESCVFTGKQGK